MSQGSRPKRGRFQVRLLTLLVLSVYVGGLWGAYVRWLSKTMDYSHLSVGEERPSGWLMLILTLGAVLGFVALAAVCEWWGRRKK